MRHLTDELAIPVKYSSVYESWINGESIQSLSVRYDLRLDELDDLLRQMAIEALAQSRKKKSRVQKREGSS